MLKRGILTESTKNKNIRNIINKTYSDYLRKIILSSNSQASKKKKKFNSYKMYNNLNNHKIENKINNKKSNFNINDYKPKNRKFAVIRNSSDILKYMPKENNKLDDDYFSLLNDFEVKFPRGNTCFYLIYNNPNKFTGFNNINSANHSKSQKIRFYQFVNDINEETYKHNISKLLLPFCIYNHKSTYYGSLNNFYNEYHLEYIYKNNKNNNKKFNSKKKEEESKNNNYYDENYKRNMIKIQNIESNHKNEEEEESNEENKHEGDKESLTEEESLDKLSFGDSDNDNELLKRRELTNHCIINIIKLPKYRNKKNIRKIRYINNKFDDKKITNSKGTTPKKIENLRSDNKFINNNKSIKETEHSKSNSKKKKIKNIEYLRDIYY